jgi:hypothetical protein
MPQNNDIGLLMPTPRILTLNTFAREHCLASEPPVSFACASAPRASTLFPGRPSPIVFPLELNGYDDSLGRDYAGLEKEGFGAGRRALDPAGTYNISDHPGAEKAFRARTDGAGCGLIKINYFSRQCERE